MTHGIACPGFHCLVTCSSRSEIADSAIAPVTVDESPAASPSGRRSSPFEELLARAVTQFSSSMSTYSSSSSNMSSPTPSTDTVTSSASNSSDGEIEMLAPRSSTPNTKCALCHETYTIPKVLNCFHTFCQPCLEKIQEAPDKIACPSCQTETHLSSASGLAGLLPDFPVSNILEANSLDNAVGTLHCTCCKSKEMAAVARCADCANFLCPNCVMAHQYMHCFEGHRVIPLEVLQKHSPKDGQKVEKPIYCSRHKHEAMLFYCETCDVPICKDCTMREHSRGHEYNYITEVSDCLFSSFILPVPGVLDKSSLFTGEQQRGGFFAQAV